MAAKGLNLERLVERVVELMGMTVDEVMDSGKDRRSVKARSILCYWATDQLRIRQTQLAQMLNLTQPAVSHAVERGKQLVKMHGCSLIDWKIIILCTSPFFSIMLMGKGVLRKLRKLLRILPLFIRTIFNKV